MQMYGEKTEETDELKMDLQDVKEMYKLQVSGSSLTISGLCPTLKCVFNLI